MRDEAFWGVKNRKSNLVLEVVLFLDLLDLLYLLARRLPSHQANRRYTDTKEALVIIELYGT